MSSIPTNVNVSAPAASTTGAAAAPVAAAGTPAEIARRAEDLAEEERLSKLGTNITGGALGSGVLMLTTKPGDATNFPKKGDTCRVHYVGTLEDGTLFDSSRARQQPFNFVLGKGSVIRGWDEAIKLMSLSQTVRLTIPPLYAYGVNGYPPIIPANATLTFDIELISFSNLSQPQVMADAKAKQDKLNKGKKK
jgi:FKBP-type peptidyl-prolyl cis-trans isomerase